MHFTNPIVFQEDESQLNFELEETPYIMNNQDIVFSSPVGSPNNSSEEELSSSPVVPQLDMTNGVEGYYNPNIVYSGNNYPVFEFYPQNSNTNFFDNTPYLTEEQMNIIQQSMNNYNNTQEFIEQNQEMSENMSRKRKNEGSVEESTRPRKKRKIEVEVDLDPNSENYKVTLSRNELLNLTSKQFETYVKQLENNKNLTEEEKKELKRQRRLIKNRESAQASRQRKKSYVDELEKKVQNLTNENSNLFDKMKSINKENEQLKAEVSYLQNMLSNSGLLNLVSNGVKKVQTQLQHDFKTSMKTTGVAFCILLFTFGIIFNIKIDSNPFESPQNMPEVLSGKAFTKEFTPTSYTNDKSYFDLFSDFTRLQDSMKKKSFDTKEKINVLKTNEQNPQLNMDKNPRLDMDKNPTFYAVKLPSSNTTYLICDYDSTLMKNEKMIKYQK